MSRSGNVLIEINSNGKSQKAIFYLKNDYISQFKCISRAWHNKSGVNVWISWLVEFQMRTTISKLMGRSVARVTFVSKSICSNSTTAEISLRFSSKYDKVHLCAIPLGNIGPLGFLSNFESLWSFVIFSLIILQNVRNTCWTCLVQDTDVRD